MELHQRELLVARVCSGTIRIRVSTPRQASLLIKRPTKDQLYVAQEIYHDVLKESELEGLYTEDELLKMLLDRGLWDDERQKQMVGLAKDIEELKVKLYKLTFRSNERKLGRKMLEVAKAKYSELSAERHSYDHESCSGAAALARSKYILGCSLFYLTGTPVFTDEAFWEQPSGLLDDAMVGYADLRLDDTAARELARTDPWRGLWACRKGGDPIFGVPASEYTEDQKLLIAWTLMYDNIHEHPDCPMDSVLEDDDMLDGWLIEQKRLREKNRLEKSSEEIVSNKKIGEAGEIFLPAETAEDAQRIMSLNDDVAKATQKQRFAYLQKHGTVNEADMPDTKQKLNMEISRLLKESVGGKK